MRSGGGLLNVRLVAFIKNFNYALGLNGLVQTERTTVVLLWFVCQVCVVGSWYEKYALIHTGMKRYTEENIVAS